MATIYTAHDGQDQLVVGGRHVKPVTDELLISVRHYVAQPRSVVLSRADVEALHLALGDWLETGWPDVPITRRTT